MLKLSIISVVLSALLAAPSVFAQTVILYQNNFENPNTGTLVNACATLDQRGINFLYGAPGTGGATGLSVPVTFAQTFTVEGIVNSSYTETPGTLGTGGKYSLGMLATIQNDHLAMTFNTGGRRYLNVAMDVSSITPPGCGVSQAIAASTFQLTLINSPGGTFNMSAYSGNLPSPATAPGVSLAQTELAAPRPIPDPGLRTYHWTKHIVALDTSSAGVSFDGNVTLVWDLLPGSPYAAFDNLIITASNTPGDVGQNGPPVANAGQDTTVNEGTPLVTLNGSSSSDPDGDALTYQWTQIGGTAVTLSSDTTVSPTFTAPFVPFGGETLTFQLVVYDGTVYSAPATVNITVANVNNPPVALAGDDQTLAEGSGVSLNGTSSYDDDGDSLTYEWIQTGGLTVALSDNMSPTPTFNAPLVGAAGETLTFRLTVSDGFNSSTDFVDIKVDNTNHNPTAEAGPPQTVAENSQVNLSGQDSSDPDSDALTYSWIQTGGPSVTLNGANTATPSFGAPPVIGASVSLTFELTVDDGYGGVSTDTVVITVRDTNAPPLCHLAQASDGLMWPPNHKFVSRSIIGVTDPDNANVAITILGVTQDEPINGLGDGDTAPDAALQGNKVLLRAERSGLGNGRVYRVNFQADDGAGGTCTGSVPVCVPHDQKKPIGCVDDGQVYNSLGF